MLRVGVLSSGNGSNFEALATKLAEGAHARVVVLLCDVPEAFVLQRARRLSIPAFVFPRSNGQTREARDTDMVAQLREAKVDIVCLAGYMRLVSARFLNAFPKRILNIHPSLLPAFPGMTAVRDALAAQALESGCTVHLVDEGVDTGPILGQRAVPVQPGDDEAKLAERIHREEHLLYPMVVEAIARDGVESLISRRKP